MRVRDIFWVVLAFLFNIISFSSAEVLGLAVLFFTVLIYILWSLIGYLDYMEYRSKYSLTFGQLNLFYLLSWANDWLGKFDEG